MTDTPTEVVHLTVTDGIATLTLDSPRNRNALGSALVEQLAAGLAAASADPAARAVVLTHTGGTFCAGADLTEALARGASIAEASAAGTQAMIALMRAIVELPKPVIARVDGHVRAGGLGLVGACDIALAGAASSFAVTEARLALAPSVISMVLLPKLTARSAGRYFLTGERFDAPVAEQIGLITRACADPADLDRTLADMLAGIRLASPQGLAASKALTTAALLATFDADADARAAESAALFASDEAREGMTAFLGKRPAAWVSQ
ncbi:MAG: enoyl-CoA hydratase family protein [Gordonia sp. (in: high G+C Gram-positive bacteria)]